VHQTTPSYRWNIILLLSTMQAIAYIDRVNFSVAGAQLTSTGVFTPAAFGALQFAFTVAFTASLLLAGPFTDWVRPRRSLPLGIGTWSLATGLCGITAAFWPLAILRGFVGVGESTMIPAGSRVIRETFEKKRRTMAVGMFFAGNKVGLTLGIPLSAMILAAWGWQWVFFITGSLGIIWLAWWLSVYRPPSRNAAAQEESTVGQEKIRWITLLKYRTTWGLILGQSGYLYIYYVFALWLPGYLVLQRDLSILQTGFVGMLPFLIGTICVVLGGWIADRLIARGGRVTLIRKGFAVSGLLGATVFTIAGAFAEGTVPAVAFLTLAVASFSFTTAAANSIPLDVAPPHIVSSLVSLQNFGGNVGGSLAPLITGFLISAAGDFTVPLLVAAGIALVFGCGSYGLLVGNLDQEYRERPPEGSAAAKL
jgi:ACS family D-galactonate transporter-like MFS transporter